MNIGVCRETKKNKVDAQRKTEKKMSEYWLYSFKSRHCFQGWKIKFILPQFV